jgi:hypothetical protein
LFDIFFVFSSSAVVVLRGSEGKVDGRGWAELSCAVVRVDFDYREADWRKRINCIPWHIPRLVTPKFPLNYQLIDPKPSPAPGQVAV